MATRSVAPYVYPMQTGPHVAQNACNSQDAARHAHSPDGQRSRALTGDPDQHTRHKRSTYDFSLERTLPVTTVTYLSPPWPLTRDSAELISHCSRRVSPPLQEAGQGARPQGRPAWQGRQLLAAQALTQMRYPHRCIQLAHLALPVHGVLTLLSYPRRGPVARSHIPAQAHSPALADAAVSHSPEPQLAGGCLCPITE